MLISVEVGPQLLQGKSERWEWDVRVIICNIEKYNFYTLTPLPLLAHDSNQIYVYIYIYIYVCMCSMYTYVYVCICVYVSMCICVFMCLCVYVYMCICDAPRML